MASYSRNSYPRLVMSSGEISSQIADHHQPRPYSNPGYLQNGATGLPPGAAPLLPNQGRVIQTGPIRVLCIADVRGMNFRAIPSV